jgi:hypothetical protein
VRSPSSWLRGLTAHAVETSAHLFPDFDASFHRASELILDAIERTAEANRVSRRRRRSGRISKRGSASARRGHGKAIVATARKLAVLFWCMLTREQDYAHNNPR